MRCAIVDSRVKKRPRDFVRRQPSEQPQRQRNPRLRRQHRMARGEDEAQQIVADIVIHGVFDFFRRGILAFLELPPELSCFSSSRLLRRR